MNEKYGNQHALDLHMKATKAVISRGNDTIKLHSRLFMENEWHDVPFCNGMVENSSLSVKWRKERIFECVALRAVLENKGNKALKLGAFHMLEGAGLSSTSREDVVMLDSAGGWFAGAVRVTASCPPYLEKWDTYYLAEEDICWAKGINDSLDAGAHYSQGGLLAYHRKSSPDLPTWIFSFIVPWKRCVGTPIMLADPITGEIRSIALSNNFAGYELAPGEQIQTEELLIGAFADPHTALEDWASICSERREVKIWNKKPPIGWLSWYGYRLTQNETDTLRTADIINEKLDGLDFEYMQLDLGYNKENLPGEWFEVNDHFPNGLAYLEKELAKRGFKLGVWLCPFLVAADSQFTKAHPEALLSLHPNDPKEWFWEPHCEMFQLDTTHPEGEKFLRDTISHFKKLGVKYFKFDFCNRMGRVDKDFMFFDKEKIPGVEIYCHGLKIIMDMLDEDDYVYWCSNLLHFGLGFGATSMTACDIGNTGFSQAKQIEGRIEGLDFFRQQVTTTMSRYYMHNKLLLLNSDSINLAPPADIEECRIRATFVAMSGGQVFLGDRFDLCEEDRFNLIKQVTPPYGVASRPVDLFEHVYPESYPQIWHLHVNTGWDEREIVALMNLDENKKYNVSLKSLGLEAGQSYHLWEFWEQRYLGCTTSEFDIDTSCPSVKLIAVVPEKEHPWILSTSFHYTQGAIELENIKWDQNKNELSGILLRPENMRGDIFFYAPDNYSCPLEQVEPNIFRYPMTGTGEDYKWNVQFSSL